jgi:type VI protein secretion system component VasA
MIKIENVFAGILVRHPYLSRFLSSFAFENRDPHMSRILSSFAFENTKEVV